MGADVGIFRGKQKEDLEIAMTFKDGNKLNFGIRLRNFKNIIYSAVMQDGI